MPHDTKTMRRREAPQPSKETALRKLSELCAGSGELPSISRRQVLKGIGRRGRTKFEVHSIGSALGVSRELLQKAMARAGIVVNLLGVMAESPPTLRGYMTLTEMFEATSFSPVERQVLLLTISCENDCEYCVAAHSMSALWARTPKAVVEAIRDDQPLTDIRLAVLHKFCKTVVRKRGWVSEADTEEFFAVGFTRAQALEVVLAIGLKTLSNYVNHIAGTPLDVVFESSRWTKEIVMGV